MKIQMNYFSNSVKLFNQNKLSEIERSDNLYNNVRCDKCKRKNS